MIQTNKKETRLQKALISFEDDLDSLSMRLVLSNLREVTNMIDYKSWKTKVEKKLADIRRLLKEIDRKLKKDRGGLK